MGQYWVVACPPNREGIRSKVGLKLGEFFFTKMPGCLTKYLAKPTKPAAAHGARKTLIQDAPKPATKKTLGSKIADARLSLLGLPTEIHHLIFKTLDIREIIALGLVDEYFWMIAKEYISRHYASGLGTWAGKNVIVTGDYTNKRDYPPGLLSEADFEELEEGFDYKGEREKPATLYSFAMFVYTRRSASHKLPTVKKLPEEFLKYPHPKDLYETVSPDLADLYDTSVPWVLRNLTTHEFVRAEAVAAKPEYIHGPVIDYVGFGHAIMCRACWSSDPSAAMGANITRGKWAGHCFDIVPLTTLEKGKDGQGGEKWTDVSEEVEEELHKIFRQADGQGWKDTIAASMDGEEQHLRKVFAERYHDEEIALE